MQKEHKYIVISKDAYESLRNLGTVTDSFDSVISRLLKERQSDTVLLAGGQKET